MRAQVLQVVLVFVAVFAASKAPMAATTSAPNFDDARLVIVGERHQRASSTTWFARLVMQRLAKGQCLGVALEISSDQQDTLDTAMRGEVPVDAVHVHAIIDHAGFRDMLTFFANEVQEGGCLAVRAIDAPSGESVKRDEWMAQQLAAMAAHRPVFALLGNLHALPGVKWEPGTNGGPFVAERLKARGMDIISIVQYWPKTVCAGPTATWTKASDSEGHAAMQAVMAPVAAETISAPDWVLIWRCS